MIEHLKFFATGAFFFTVFLGILSAAAWLAYNYLFLFLLFILIFPLHWLGKNVLTEYRYFVEEFGKDWWKN